MIGIIQVIPQQMTPVGSHLRLSTILVHQVGVFLTVEVMAYGKLQDSQIRHMTIQMKEYHSVSAVHPPLGIQLRVIAATTMGHWNLSASTAAIGQFLLTAATHTACTSTAMAVSVRRATAIGRTATRSVVSKKAQMAVQMAAQSMTTTSQLLAQEIFLMKVLQTATSCQAQEHTAYLL